MVKKFLFRKYIKTKQNRLNNKYAKKGLTDDILEKQLKINKFKHKHNISDENSRIYKNFVQ